MIRSIPLLMLIFVAGCDSLPGINLFPAAKGIGMVDAVIGEPRVFRNGASFIVQARVPLQDMDTVITGADDRIRLKMSDGSMITLGGGSELAFHVYSFISPSPLVRISFSQGAFRLKPGRLVKRDDARFRIATPLATLVVTGGEVWGGDRFQDHQLDVLLLDDGEVRVFNGHGSTRLARQYHGTTVNFGNAPLEAEAWPIEEIEDVIASTTLEIGP